jgi:hypothetical protein
MNRVAKIFSTFLLILIFRTSASAQEDHAKLNENANQNTIHLILSCNKTEFREEDSITLEAKLINMGTEKLSVFGQLLWGYSGGLTLHITGSNGQRAIAQHYDHDMVVPTAISDPKSYVLLLPNHFLGTTRTDSCKNLFRKSGTYKIFAEYNSPISAKYTKMPCFWGREHALIRSLPLVIEIKEE